MSIDEPGSNSKAFVVTEPELEENRNLIGEVAIIVRPENTKQTKTLFYTADSLVRSYQPVSHNMHWRNTFIQDDIDFLGKTSKRLLADWREFKSTEIELVSFFLKLKSIRLLNARTVKRQAAGSKLQAVSEFRDSLGRPNPLIASTVLSAAARRLVNQYHFDTRSLRSVENWGVLGESLARSIQEDTEQLFHLLNRSTSLVSSQLPKFLRKLWIKPTIYAAMFTRWEITNSGLSEGSKSRIRAAYIAEMALVDLSSALSEIRNHPDRINSNTAKLLDFTIADIDIHDCYAQLFGDIKRLLPQISHDYADNKLSSGKKHIAKVKSLIRDRFVEDEDSPWSFQNALATP
jgi:hypothetical protein